MTLFPDLIYVFFCISYSWHYLKIERIPCLVSWGEYLLTWSSFVFCFVICNSISTFSFQPLTLLTYLLQPLFHDRFTNRPRNLQIQIGHQSKSLKIEQWKRQRGKCKKDSDFSLLPENVSWVAKTGLEIWHLCLHFACISIAIRPVDQCFVMSWSYSQATATFLPPTRFHLTNLDIMDKTTPDHLLLQLCKTSSYVGPNPCPHFPFYKTSKIS